MSKNTAIKVEHLSKTFTLQHPVKDETGNDIYDLCALKDVSFEVKRGESVGIIGANGSGKSTLLKILAGITKPTSGEVTIYGRIASILDIGAGFHPELSGKENVFLNGQILGFTQKEIQNKYDDIVEFSGIGSFINEPVKSYSNGMYLRLAFSIMAHLDFDVYLFDEVFSVGDAEFALRTKEKFMELIASDKTMLFVSHNMSELSNQNLYILLEKGKVKGLTKDTSILSEYLESGLKKSGGEVFTQNTTLADFSKFPSSTEIKVLKVELLQEGTEQYRTDKPFTLKLEFENLIEQDTIDIVLRIHDIQGNIILSATSLLSNHSSKSGKGIYSYTCVLPASIFGFQPYKLGVFFVKNAAAAIHESESALTVSVNSMENMASSAYVLDNLLTFKPQFKLGDVEVNLSNLNINGGLLPVLDWTLSFSKS